MLSFVVCLVNKHYSYSEKIANEKKNLKRNGQTKMHVSSAYACTFCFSGSSEGSRPEPVQYFGYLGVGSDC